MERIRSLGRYQKAVLLATALMALVFTAVYLTVTARVGFAFGDAILLDVHGVTGSSPVPRTKKSRNLKGSRTFYFCQD